MPELWQQPAVEIVERYNRGECSPVEVLNSVLDRIEKINHNAGC